jgi:GT2 family glycosyltransferase
MCPQIKQINVIMVHFGDEKPLQRALKSLALGRRRPDNIIVIDHALSPLRLKDTAVRVVRPNINGGYGSGINIGLGTIYSMGVEKDDIVICMNNEVEVYEDTLEQLEKWWTINPTASLVGAVVEEGTKIVSGLGAVNLFTGRADPYAESRRFKIGNLSYVHGAFFAAPYHVFLKTKGMPEDNFLYWEDVAFSQNVSRASFPLRTALNVRVKHSHQKDVTGDNRTYYLVRNGAIFMEHYLPQPLKQMWWLINRIRYAYHSVWEGHQSETTKALKDAVRGKRGVMEAP